MYGANKAKTDHRFRIREKNVFNRILSRMRRWFADIS
jgi:cell division protein FtsA